MDPRIWAPARRKKKVKRIIERLIGMVASIWAPALVVVGPLLILMVILGTYYIVGPRFLGLTLLGVLSIFLGGFVLVAEKTGYARNFERWSSPLTAKRLVAVISVFAVVLAVFYLALYVGKP